MDEADSRAAVAAAERAKVTTATWLGRAIRECVAREREPISAVTGEVIEPAAASVPDPETWNASPLDILHAPGAPQWLKAGASRLLAARLGIDVPKRRPEPRRLQGPSGGRQPAERNGGFGGTAQVPPSTT